MIMNDWSARDSRAPEMKVGLGPAKGKDFATTLGPWIVTADEFAEYLDPDGFLDLEASVSVNGHEVGRDLLTHMGWGFNTLIAYASRDSGCAPETSSGRGPPEAAAASLSSGAVTGPTTRRLCATGTSSRSRSNTSEASRALSQRPHLLPHCPACGDATATPDQRTNDVRVLPPLARLHVHRGLGRRRLRRTPMRIDELDPADPEGAIAGRRGAGLELGTLGRRRRARHDELPRRGQAGHRGRADPDAGMSFSLSQRFDMDGPQKGWRRRTNPVHTMLDTGTDAAAGIQGFPHGLGGADDVVTMPLQCSTQWDGLGHIFDHGVAWNGRPADRRGDQPR